MDRFRIAALVLAAGGTVWGIALFPLLRSYPPLVAILGPSLVLTLGFWARGLWPLSREWRRRIWKTSAVVMMAYLIVIAEEAFMIGSQVPWVLAWFGWWTLASVVAFVAMLKDRNVTVAV